MTGQPELDFAAVLRQLRTEARLTQEELAEAARMSPRTVSNLERGINKTAHKDTAALLADALSLTAPVRGLFLMAARGRAAPADVLTAATAPMAAATAGPPTSGAAGGPAARPVPRELPADVSAFTGRAGELAELDRLLAEADHQAAGGASGPVVISAVSGTAGVGKTALAVRWAHRVQEEFADGQLYVNLRGYDPDQPVPAADALAGFLRALGVADTDIPAGEAERAARFRSVAAGRRLLVVLDNAATVEQVRPLLPGTGTALVVVTSRDSLAGLVARDGARRVDLDLLPIPDAVALLRTLIGDRVDADPASAQKLAGLCARLPLALRVAAELTAARTGTPLAELTAELAGEGRRLELLDAGGDPRSAVVSVFSWSCRHLHPDAVRMFGLLGLHPGPSFDQYAAAALSGTSLAQAGRLLGMLARAHLIQPAEPGRYGMHDLLRAYAAGLAADNDTDPAPRAALTRLFDYYLAGCAAAMDTLVPAERRRRPAPPPAGTPVPELGDHATARAWLDGELATFTAVAAHTASHGWPGHTTRLAATLHRYLYGGHFTEGITIHAHALTAARDCGDRAAQASALASLGGFHYSLGSHQRAADCHRQALSLVRGTGDRVTEGRALTNLSLIYLAQGLHRQALTCQQQAVVLFRELGDLTGEAVTLVTIGIMYKRQGPYQQAADQLQQAFVLSRQAGDRFGEAVALTNLGEVCFRQGCYQQAAGFQRQALAVSGEIGDRSIEAHALTRLGDVHHRQRHHGQAGGYHQQALALYREIGDRDGEADALNGAGQTLLATGQPDQARTCHNDALTLARQTGYRPEQARALTLLGQACQHQGLYDQAADYHQQALALYREIGDRGGQADALNGAGETLLATGQPDKARACHNTALTLSRRTGDRYQQARAHYGLGDACHAAGRVSLADQHWQLALDIHTDLGVPEAARVHVRPASWKPTLTDR